MNILVRIELLENEVRTLKNVQGKGDPLSKKGGLFKTSGNMTSRNKAMSID